MSSKRDSAQSAQINQLSIPTIKHFPFLEHPQFITLLDTLIRKNSQHIWLKMQTGNNIRKYFSRAFFSFVMQRLSEQVTAYQIENVSSFNSHEFEMSCQRWVTATSPFTLLFFTDAALYQQATYLLPQSFALLRKNSTIRFIVFTADDTPCPPDFYSSVFSSHALAAEQQSILKQIAHEISDHYSIPVSDDMINLAQQLARRYLNPANVLEKTELLLDTAAARLKWLPQTKNRKKESVLNNRLLEEIIADWTQIPIENIVPLKIHPNSMNQIFTPALIGQAPASEQICASLTKLDALNHSGPHPLASFLFVGEDQQGQNTAAEVIAQHLFQRQDLLYGATIQPHINSLFELFFEKSSSNRLDKFENIIEREPFAIIFLEGIENANLQLQRELQQYLIAGYVNHANQQWVVNQTSLILTTKCASSTLCEYIKPQTERADLMQIMLAPQQKTATVTGDIIKQLNSKLSEQLRFITLIGVASQLTVCPFLPLTPQALKEILQKLLAQKQTSLATNLGFELQIAPEVISFLVASAQAQQATLKELLAQLDDLIGLLINHDKQSNRHGHCLLLQLNTKGDQLRGEWLTHPVTWQHSL